jgi:hypothetical protein
MFCEHICVPTIPFMFGSVSMGVRKCLVISTELGAAAWQSNGRTRCDYANRQWNDCSATCYVIIIINCSNNSASRYEVKLHQIGIGITRLISHRQETPKSIQNINYFLVPNRKTKLQQRYKKPKHKEKKDKFYLHRKRTGGMSAIRSAILCKV